MHINIKVIFFAILILMNEPINADTVSNDEGSGFEEGSGSKDPDDLLPKCTDGLCSHSCVDTIFGYACECPETMVLDKSQTTCIQRPAEADCDYGFLALGQSCVKFVNRRVSHKFANNICKMENSRLVTINDETTASFMNSFPPSWIGAKRNDEVFVASDGSNQVYTKWSNGMPGFFDDCVYLNHGGYLDTVNCKFRRTFICEKPRLKPELIFTRTWPNGGLAKLYWSYKAEAIQVNFPSGITKLHSWFCSHHRLNETSFVFQQNSIERLSGRGRCEFMFRSYYRFAEFDSSVEVVCPTLSQNLNSTETLFTSDCL